MSQLPVLVAVAEKGRASRSTGARRQIGAIAGLDIERPPSESALSALTRFEGEPAAIAMLGVGRLAGRRLLIQLLTTSKFLVEVQCASRCKEVLIANHTVLGKAVKAWARTAA
jgi:hypothetical protein